MLGDDWITADWPAPAGIVAGCTARTGGVSEGQFASLNLAQHVGDVQQNVLTNRKRFIAAGCLPAEPTWLNQVHGVEIAIDPAPESRPEADAILCTRPESVCAVLVADCLPVLLVSKDGAEIAAAHAGWRGLSAGVLEAVVGAFTATSKDVLAWLGPAISQTHFEVGDEVRQAFLDHDSAAGGYFSANAQGKWQADLVGIAKRKLANAGVGGVFGGDFCTFGDPQRFFSFRRDGQCGRMAAFIGQVVG